MTCAGSGPTVAKKKTDSDDDDGFDEYEVESSRSVLKLEPEGIENHISDVRLSRVDGTADDIS
jgi:hypothetical protein